MPPWITIAASELPISPAEIELLRSYKPETYDDFVGECIANGIAYVRGVISARAGFRLDADRTLIPPELKRQALWLIIESVKVDASVGLALTEDQVRMCKTAREDLQRVVDGAFAVSAPLNPEPSAEIQSGTGAVEIITPRTRLFGRDSTSGL